MSTEADAQEIEAGTALFLSYITPKFGDPTHTILKTHLLFEEILRDLLDRTLPNPKALNGARLTFAQLLAVARATSRAIPADSWEWVAIDRLNKLRNLLAHNHEPATIQREGAKIADYIIKSLATPFPGTVTQVADAKDPGPGPHYFEIDMALIGLFSRFGTLVGFNFETGASTRAQPEGAA